MSKEKTSNSSPLSVPSSQLVSSCFGVELTEISLFVCCGMLQLFIFQVSCLCSNSRFNSVMPGVTLKGHMQKSITRSNATERGI